MLRAFHVNASSNSLVLVWAKLSGYLATWTLWLIAPESLRSLPAAQAFLFVENSQFLL
jgi:hypothetical protein